MKRDKILVVVDDLGSISAYEKLGISNFLFPLENYSVGYRTYTFEEIEKTGAQAFVLMNRLLTDRDIDDFQKLVIPSNVKGFIVEDIGLLEPLSKTSLKVINFQNHLNANYASVLYWLNYYDSLVVSTDITEEEIKEMLDRTPKPLVIYTLGRPMIMYSRRKLISNFYENVQKDKRDEVTLNDPKGEFSFKLRETEYGTACFDSKILDARKTIENFPDEKIAFYLIDAQTVGKENVTRAIEGEILENATDGFLHKKTVYRIGDLK